MILSRATKCPHAILDSPSQGAGRSDYVREAGDKRTKSAP